MKRLDFVLLLLLLLLFYMFFYCSLLWKNLKKFHDTIPCYQKGTIPMIIIPGLETMRSPRQLVSQQRQLYRCKGHCVWEPSLSQAIMFVARDKQAIATSKIRENGQKGPNQAINKECDNLGTPRTENWPIIFNLLIGLIHPELNFRGIRLFRKFQIFNIS